MRANPTVCAFWQGEEGRGGERDGTNDEKDSALRIAMARALPQSGVPAQCPARRTMQLNLSVGAADAQKVFR